MKTVRIKDGIVIEIIPQEATVPSVSHWYGEDFAAECMDTPDDVQQNWLYDSNTQTFSEPSQVTEESPPPTPEDQIASLQNENRLLSAQVKAVSESNSFLEECVVEMAGIVYA
jgi:hypothetical protein